MVRFSCFQAHIHSHKHKKTVQLSSEAMQKTLEDSSQTQSLRNFSYLTTESKPCLKEEGARHNNITDHVTDYSPTERDCRSEEMEGKSSTDCDIAVHKNAQIKKSQSLGSVLNWEEKTSGADVSEYDIEQRFSYDGSADRSGVVVADGTKSHGLSLSDQFQEPMPSDSVQVDSDVAKNMSIFSIGDPQQTEKECAEKDDISLSGVVDSGGLTPVVRPFIVKSSSLPRMGSPSRLSTSLLTQSRSAEDLNTLDSRKKDIMHEVGRQIQLQERDNSVFNYDKNNGETPADETDETYNNYVGSAKDWIIPVSDGANVEKGMKGETSFHHWHEIPTKDFRLKRIEDWVINLQHCGPLEESNKSSCYDQELSKEIALPGEPTATKLEAKVNPGMEAAKRYISSLNPSATAAQLTNLGLAVIPFLSAFVSLKALNLSGNSIVRIAAGALPRGLHILNLSKNNISTIEGLRDLTRLRVLDLSYNRILRIGHGLAACSSLKELYLAGNKISEVEGLHRLLKLTVLDLRFNKISTTKCLGQLAANYNCLQALSLEGNPAQKNVGDEQLKKYVQSLLPNLTYYNRQAIKVGTMKDTTDRSARLGISSHQVDRGLRVEVKTTMRKGTHGIVAQKVASSSSNHGRKSQAVASPKATRSSRHGRLPPRASQGHHFADFSSKLTSLRNDLSIPRSRSEGNLGVL
ncbi:hypothetical protein CDL12_23147 [Handroanthus impetiginosus]|uniref:Protein phosphatase 1, regulatory subunit n=1 Tax=Handroanthus impetiginosus TaxID=429701 RepID=A0A2G9GG94_9LAMI|nr:hypothetical protein CDL12_23147 [Handroanthus impetiginosus]